MRPPVRSWNRSRRSAVTMAFVAVFSACGAPEPERTSPRTGTPSGGNQPAAEDGWEGRTVTGLAAGYLSDVAASESGAMVAVWTVSTDEPAVAIGHSDDGVTWQEAFRQGGNPSEDDAFVGMPGAAVAHDGGFAAVFAACSDGCRPVGVFSSDGKSWQQGEVEVRSAVGEARSVGRSGGGADAVGAKRLIRATPDYTIQGAEILDVVAAGDRLVGVGWSEADGYRTLMTVWHSDDGGRTWRQAPVGTFPANGWRDELNRIVRAGDRLVASGGNRCCHDQAVGEIWISDLAGEHWRAVSLPERISVSDLIVLGDDVHIFGRLELEMSDRQVHWRLSADDRWERLSALPRWGRVVALGDGLVAAMLDPEVADAQQRLVLLRSLAGGPFERWKTSVPLEAPQLHTAEVVGDRLFAYVTTDTADGARRLLFEASESD